jgi:hypothetical protein
METTASINHPTLTAAAATGIWQNAETNRCGINMPVLSLAIIPGGMAVQYAVNLGGGQFARVLFPTVFTLILVVGLAPLWMIIYTAAFALVMNLIMFFAGVLS